MIKTFTYNGIFYIGVIGGFQSGKSTLGEIIQSQFGARTQILHFSTPLKEMLSTGLKIPMEYFINPNLKNDFNLEQLKLYPNMTTRTLMQKIGQSMRDNIGEDIFINLLINSIDQTKKIIIIPDVRHRNEEKFIRARNGIIVKLKKEGVQEGDSSIPSESYWPSIIPDIEIINDLDIDKFYSQIREYIFPLIPKECFIERYSGWDTIKEPDTTSEYIIDIKIDT